MEYEKFLDAVDNDEIPDSEIKDMFDNIKDSKDTFRIGMAFSYLQFFRPALAEKIMLEHINSCQPKH